MPAVVVTPVVTTVATTILTTTATAVFPSAPESHIVLRLLSVSLFAQHFGSERASFFCRLPRRFLYLCMMDRGDLADISKMGDLCLYEFV
jgi:hypothetical protein